MLQDGLILADSSVAENLQIQNGATLPSSGTNVGELFFNTSNNTLYIHTGSAWAGVSGGGGSVSAGDLTGTTLAANVVSSSLTSVGTITSGTWSGSFGAVSGANLTTLNASNLSSGTVATARLGSGTADNTTFLRGDNTWATPTATVTSLTGTSTIASPVSTTKAVYVGLAPTSAYPSIYFVNSSAPTDEKRSGFYIDNGGTFNLALYGDSTGTVTPFTIARTGTTATNITLAGTAITLSGAVTGTSFAGDGSSLTALNASNLSTGTVGTARLGSGTANSTTFLRGDGSWAVPTAAATTVAATGTVSASSGTTGVYAGVNASAPAVYLTNAAAGVDLKTMRLVTAASGQFKMTLLPDSLSTETTFLSVDRSTTTASNITLTGTAITLNGAVTGTSFSGNGSGLTALNGTNISTGTVGTARLGSGTADNTTYLRGDGTWSTISVSGSNSLVATATLTDPSAATKAVHIGISPSTQPAIWFVSPSAAAGNKRFAMYQETNGNMSFRAYADAATTGTNILAINRTPANAVVVTGTLTATSYAANFVPSADNTYALGGPTTQRWTTVYATTGTINTSDARQKTVVSALTANELAAAKQLGSMMGTYKFLDAIATKGEANARKHVGMTVQDAIGVMTSHGLDPMAYGFICYDSWAEETDPETGAVVRAAGDSYGFRYEELLAFIAAGFNARLAALEAAAGI